MSNKTKTYKNLSTLADKLRGDLEDNKDNLNNKDKNKDFILLYAYNGIGKTRLSIAFKEEVKKPGENHRDTLYFNAFTEDLFTWDNDLDGDSKRMLKLNVQSSFFAGLEEFEIETRVRGLLHYYADFDFEIDTDKWKVHFFRKASNEEDTELFNDIKISRGEENLFIWCFFLAIVQLAMDKKIEAYAWVKYLYIDDPISSIDDNNAIAVAAGLASILKSSNKDDKTTKAVISSHHSLFFNVMYNELKNEKINCYFLHKNLKGYTLQYTNETPFLYHIALLKELKQLAESGKLYTYHFNILRGILEKTAVFFGLNHFSKCIEKLDDEKLYTRVLQLLIHEKYSIYNPKEMLPDNKELFKKILNGFIHEYPFNLSEPSN